jgi:hypothetical protein
MAGKRKAAADEDDSPRKAAPGKKTKSEPAKTKKAAKESTHGKCFSVVVVVEAEVGLGPLPKICLRCSEGHGAWSMDLWYSAPRTKASLKTTLQHAQVASHRSPFLARSSA